MKITKKGPALELVLKHKYFVMIKSGFKKDEYRDTTDYWVKRLLINPTFNKNGDIIGGRLIDQSTLDALRQQGRNIIDEFEKGNATPRWCGDVIFYDGYAKDRESVTVEILDTDIREGRPEWGAVPGKVYIVLELGNIISNE